MVVAEWGGGVAPLLSSQLNITQLDGGSQAAGSPLTPGSAFDVPLWEVLIRAVTVTRVRVGAWRRM